MDLDKRIAELLNDSPKLAGGHAESNIKALIAEVIEAVTPERKDANDEWSKLNLETQQEVFPMEMDVWVQERNRTIDELELNARKLLGDEK